MTTNQKTPPPAAQEARSVSAPRTRARTGRVLIVEDDLHLCQALSIRLRQAGYDACVTRDGAFGLELFASVLPDAVIVDLRLPTKGGVEVIRELRAAQPQLPILVITGNPREDVERYVREMGVDFVRKPFEARDIVQRIDELLA